ncbi:MULTISPECIES: endonuclease/exonuclease/phosphatase family protein [unclassified Streptomyces]|uniref:endonuclease/exonuclease/phosphatase family protein n=1 Tax=unclassified Streptomyces TaxID=2593676 RepID=UPI0033FB599C
MKNRLRMPRLLAATLIGVLLHALLGMPATAAVPPLPNTSKSAGQQWELFSLATAKYVSVEAAGGDELHARAGTPGVTEQFTLHTDNTAKGATVSMRSQANGRYVTAEFGAGAEGRYGKLRARTDGPPAAWEKLELVPQPQAGADVYALRYHDGTQERYVKADASANGDGLLQARASAVASWELFRLVAVAAPAEPSPPPAAPLRAIKALTWNVCADNNNACGFYHTAAGPLADQIVARAKTAGHPDVIMLEEFCEKFAKPVELALETQLGGGWDVRFAPVQYEVPGTKVKAQKNCRPDASGADRGAYGVALAVPEENTWYRAVELPSPPGVEQRTALCATVVSWAAEVCAAHFSTGGPGYDDPDRTFQPQQAQTLRQAASLPGYRALLGGDLNAAPATGVPATLYAAFEECDAHSATPNQPTAGSSKIDYLFGGGSWTGCGVAADTGSSDHRAVWGTLTLP